MGVIIGGFILTALGIGTAGTGFIWTIIAGIIGAVILLAIY
ncbi:MAG: GlsB/YeaQ/YmgE family stress response membrane protein, partial [Actinomycetota bacterium]|nr:GlsB/YeaQ/YmgE family stress response membrane protein [Actinomycetota bacterium]